MLWLWKKVWDHRIDVEFETDTAVASAAAEFSRLGWPITRKAIPAMADHIGARDDDCEAAFGRLIDTGVLRPSVFNPPRPTAYKITNKPVRRSPLSGIRFRPPLRRDGLPWGPRPMEDTCDQRVELTDKQVYEVMDLVKKHRPRGMSADARQEIEQDVLLAVVAGKLKVADIPTRISSFAAQATAKSTKEHSAWDAYEGEL